MSLSRLMSHAFTIKDPVFKEHLLKEHLGSFEVLFTLPLDSIPDFCGTVCLIVPGDKTFIKACYKGNPSFTA